MKQKNILKLAAAAFAMIGAGMILFNTAAEVTLAANNGKMEVIPTSYQVPSGNQVSDGPETALPESAAKKESGGKVNYSVSMDSLNTGTPTDTDLTMEEAAEMGAQYLRNIYGLDLEGAYVYMMYSPGTVTFPRAFWTGDVLFQREQTPEATRWTYQIDAVTGELFSACHGRQLEVSVPLGYDSALEKDYHLYAELAKKKTEECKLIDGTVDRVEYNCQGYSNNDPTISLEVIGGNGEIVNMSFSRYDQVLLGVLTDTALKVSDSALMRLSGEVMDGEEMETERVGMTQ